MPEHAKRYVWAFVKGVLRATTMLAVIGAALAIFHPETPLPDQWNPRTPLSINAPISGLTGWKLRHALADDALCLQVLEAGGARFKPQVPLEHSDVCHIRPRLTLTGVGDAGMAAIETRCQTALRTAMWEAHGLQAAASRHLDSRVRQIRHYSSYNCRKMRTEAGESTRMSTHATANALDVSGFVMGDGDIVDLRRDWPGAGPKAAFLRDAFESACMWFPVALGPAYNSLHADHFHLQTKGWGLCR